MSTSSVAGTRCFSLSLHAVVVCSAVLMACSGAPDVDSEYQGDSRGTFALRAVNAEPGEIVLFEFVSINDCLTCMWTGAVIGRLLEDERRGRVRRVCLLACSRGIEARAFQRKHDEYDTVLVDDGEMRSVLHLPADVRYVVIESDGSIRHALPDRWGSPDSLRALFSRSRRGTSKADDSYPPDQRHPRDYAHARRRRRTRTEGDCRQRFRRAWVSVDRGARTATQRRSAQVSGRRGRARLDVSVPSWNTMRVRTSGRCSCLRAGAVIFGRKRFVLSAWCAQETLLDGC